MYKESHLRARAAPSPAPRQMISRVCTRNLLHYDVGRLLSGFLTMQLVLIDSYGRDGAENQVGEVVWVT